MSKDAFKLKSILKKWRSQSQDEQTLKTLKFLEEIQPFGIPQLVLQSAINAKTLKPLELYAQQINKQCLLFKENAKNQKLVRLLYGSRPGPKQAEPR